MQTIQVTVFGNRCLIEMDHITAWGFCGTNGATRHKQEGDGKTPLGYFPIYYGFFTGQRPGTPLPMVRLTPQHYCIHHPSSPCYNRLVFGRPNHPGEHMTDHPEEYALGFVIEYNRRPSHPGAGSAIFFHCGAHPTAGCVAAEPRVVAQILARLDPQLSPHIHIKKPPISR